MTQFRPTTEGQRPVRGRFPFISGLSPSRAEVIALLVILVIAAYLRLNSLDYAQMKADDANLWDIVASFLQQPRILTQGIPSSLGLANGPFQAYLLLLAIPFTREPIGAYVVVAVLNIAAVLACWGFSRAYFGSRVALIAALLFATNPWAVIFSRRLWGNDMTALFTVLLIWSLCDLINKGRRRDSFLPFLWLAILAQTYLVALVNVITLPIGLLFGLKRLRLPWLAMGFTSFALLIAPYALYAVVPRLDTLQRVTDQLGIVPTTDTESLRFLFHIVGNEGYQAFANQAGGIYDASAGLPAFLSLFLEGLLVVGLAVGLYRVIQAFRQRRYSTAAPYLLMAVPVILPASLLIRHAAPVYPYYLLVGYPMHFIFSALGAQWIVELGSRLPKELPLSIRYLPTGLTVAALSLVLGVQLLLAQVFFSVIKEYWPESEYGLPLAHIQKIVTSAEEMAATRSVDSIYVAGPNEHDRVLYTVLRRRIGNVFHFNSANVFVAPETGQALYIMSNVPSTKAGEVLATSPVKALSILPVPGSGLAMSFIKLGAEEAKSLVSDIAPLTPSFNFDTAARLDGAYLEEKTDGAPELRLKWTSLGRGPLYTYYFRLIDNTSNVYASFDTPFFFSEQWRPGDQVVNWLKMPKPNDLPQGQYWYLSGLYLPTSVNTYKNLPITDSSGNRLDGVKLGPLVVHAAENSQPITPLKRDFEEKISFLGYDIESSQLRLGGTVRVTLYWQARTKLDRDYTVFTHFVNEKGQLVAQHDSPPDNGRFPTSAWQPGKVVLDGHEIKLPDLPPGDYRLLVGLYLPKETKRLKIDNNIDSVDLGIIKLGN